MKRILIGLLLFLTAFLQTTWIAIFKINGFFFSPVLVLLLFALLYTNVEEILLFSFAVGLLLDLLGTSTLGEQSLTLIISVMASFVGRSLFIKRAFWSGLIGFGVGLLAYEFTQRLLFWL